MIFILLRKEQTKKSDQGFHPLYGLESVWPLPLPLLPATYKSVVRTKRVHF